MHVVAFRRKDQVGLLRQFNAELGLEKFSLGEMRIGLLRLAEAMIGFVMSKASRFFRGPFGRALS